MITLDHVTKTYGTHRALSDVTFTAPAGRVTGFLGPNGAGKSTSMRILVGLDEPTSGTATILGRPYRELARPLHTVGTLLDPAWVFPPRTGRAHLEALAATHGIGVRRVDEVLEMVGLAPAARRPVKGYSLGMRQRLGIAAAILGDPEFLVLDEPVNGLDPDGVIWVRELLRGYAAQGRGVLLSSHLLSEMAQVADDVVVIARGKVLATGPVEQLTGTQDATTVVSDDDARLAAALAPLGEVVPAPEGGLAVTGLTPTVVGQVACREGIALRHLAERRITLEDAFLQLVDDGTNHPAQARVAQEVNA